jgi:transposase-like protein
VKGKDRYLYRAVDSTGQTIDFLLTARRDTAGVKRFLLRAVEASGNPMPCVINVDKNPPYPAAIEVLTAEGTLPSRVRLRQCKYLNNVIEQDHRTVKKRTWLAKGYGSFQGAESHQPPHNLSSIESQFRLYPQPVGGLERNSALTCYGNV